MMPFYLNNNPIPFCIPGLGAAVYSSEGDMWYNFMYHLLMETYDKKGQMYIDPDFFLRRFTPYRKRRLYVPFSARYFEFFEKLGKDAYTVLDVRKTNELKAYLLCICTALMATASKAIDGQEWERAFELFYTKIINKSKLEENEN